MMHMVVIIFQSVFSGILSLGGLGNLGLRKMCLKSGFKKHVFRNEGWPMGVARRGSQRLANRVCDQKFIGGRKGEESSEVDRQQSSELAAGSWS